MNNPMRITMDSITYRVCIVADSYVDSFELVEGPNAGDMLNDRHERDLSGTKATYSMQVEPDPRFPLDYTAFYEAIRSPVNSHTITVLDGQSTLTYQAQIQSGSRVYDKTVNGVRFYKGVVVNFVPESPQWEASNT